ncbi:hypothetical protein SAMD00023353_1002810 [Rosellinia necatrix]|uniref:HNH nuclease domain-containing protein n=1 Tax=Rosellinia necatrix TaxID=77044 RepID=A0A1W2TBF7_ROSNE|nr:hypothetical protein SAMD00023353_1002810 [Rosellinia necatrix]
MPLRQKPKTASPSERSESRSVSPRRESLDDDNETKFEDMLAPISVDETEARKLMDSFRSSCLRRRATYCAVSREGKAWHNAQPIGPSIDACHIIPPEHYYLYPLSDGRHFNNVDSPEDRLRMYEEAWKLTWNAMNGILLRKDLHSCFDMRLFSIHPDSYRIRVFVPYDTLIKFNGKEAGGLRHNTDSVALRHHYEMCCIENMAADRPDIDITSPIITRSMLGTERYLPLTPGLEGASKDGDPYRRRQSDEVGDARGQDNLAGEAGVDVYEDDRRYKRRRLTEC